MRSSLVLQNVLGHLKIVGFVLFSPICPMTSARSISIFVTHGVTIAILAIYLPFTQKLQNLSIELLERICRKNQLQVF